MKTREIEGWVYPDSTILYERFPDNFDEIGGLKARLIIEIPEKKITISESEFDKSLGGLIFESSRLFEAEKFLTNIKQRLFKETN